MLKALRSAVAVALLLLVPCLASAIEEKEIIVGGGGDAIVGFFAPVSETFQDEFHVRLFLNVNNPSKAFIDLVNGYVDIATGTISLQEMAAEASKKSKIDLGDFVVTTIGSNVTRLVTHKTNPISSFTKEQLKEILTGKVTNWKTLGGPDKEISVVWGELTGAQNDLVKRELMDGQPLGAKKIAATNYINVRKKVMENQWSIGFVPEALLSSLLKAPDAPKLTSPVIAVTKGKPEPKEKKLLDFLLEIASVF
jgi:phosphate transport system substrate-binding protein